MEAISRQCVEYGGGTNGYLNPMNYRARVMTSTPNKKSLAALGGSLIEVTDHGGMG